MSLIDWNKPKRVERGGGFDGGPEGGYIPQMSKEDMRKWKGKHINKGKSNERIELRKSFDTCNEYAQVLIVIGNQLEPKYTTNEFHRSETPGNVRISANGSIEMTFAEYEEFAAVVKEAKELLEF